MSTETTLTDAAMTTSGQDEGRTVAEITAAVRAVALRARDEAVERELESHSPAALVADLAAAGLGAVRVPVDFGGAGGSFADLASLLVEVAAADSNLTQIVRGHLGFIEFLLARPLTSTVAELLRAAGRGELFGPAASVSAAGPSAEAPGTPDGAAAGPAASLIDSSTRLHREGSRLLLTGEKYYTTGSLYSDWINVLVIGELGMSGAGVAGVGVAEVGVAEVVIRRDAPGITVIDDWNGFGQRRTASGTARFDGVEVRPEHVLRYEGDGLHDFLTAVYQFVHSATQAGILSRATDDLGETVRGRHRTYALAVDPEPRRDAQVLAVVGEVSSAAFAAAAVVDATARALDRYVDDRSPATLTAAAVASASAQVHNTRLAGEALWHWFDAASASSVAVDRALDRHWRNARTISSHNPVIYKARLVGEVVVNGSLPERSVF